MSGIKQSERLMQFSSSLGKDVLLIESCEGVEAISRLFEFHVELLAETGTAIAPKAIVGTKVTVSINLNDAQGSRYVNGLVAAFEQASGDSEFDVYRAHIVPSLWQLTLSSNCRTFQDLTVMDIVKKVISVYGLTISDQTTHPFQSLDYCTQYAESDFDFVSRILEQHGVFYWFEHSDSDNKVVFADARDAYPECAISSTVSYSPQGAGQEGAYGATISEFNAMASMIPGKHTWYDYDYRTYGGRKPDTKSSASPFGNNAYERYLYPAGEQGYVKLTDKKQSTPDHASLFLASQATATDAAGETYHGVANARSFCAGYTFTMKDHPRSGWNRKYLLTEIVHHASQSPSYRSSTDSDGGYSNRFSAIVSDIVYKTPTTTPKPRIYGPQTAMVVVPSGEEQYIDKLGRVCVHFFWDRDGKSGVDNTWVRVGQPWAGSGWGTFFWPRVNDEVIIQFIDGDPDSPVIVGSVYNGVNVPKYELPEHGTRTGIYTRSSKNGSAQNANELRFEDKKGSEQIFLNAEMDMDHRVENDHRRFVGGKDSLIVKGAQYDEIDGDRHSNMKANLVEKVAEKADLDVGTDLNEKVGQNYSLKIGQNHAEKVGQNYTLDAGMDIYLKAGMNVIIESGMNLCLKGAGGFITIGPAGVAISGTMVMINSGGAAVPGTPGQLTDPGAPTAPDEADDGTKGGKK
jgi:type VI secretion system secreted protein VgrG